MALKEDPPPHDSELADNESASGALVIDEGDEQTGGDGLEAEFAEMPRSELLDVPSDGQCGLHALRSSARATGVEKEVEEALARLGWTNIPRRRQWTDDALGAVAIEAGLRLVIFDESSRMGSSFGAVEAAHVLFLHYKGEGLHGHYRGVRIVGPELELRFRVASTLSLDPEAAMVQMTALTPEPRATRGRTEREKGEAGAAAEEAARKQVTPPGARSSEDQQREDELLRAGTDDEGVETLAFSEREDIDRYLEETDEEAPTVLRSTTSVAAESATPVEGLAGLSLQEQQEPMELEGSEEVSVAAENAAVSASPRHSLPRSDANQPAPQNPAAPETSWADEMEERDRQQSKTAGDEVRRMFSERARLWGEEERRLEEEKRQAEQLARAKAQERKDLERLGVQKRLDELAAKQSSLGGRLSGRLRSSATEPSRCQIAAPGIVPIGSRAILAGAPGDEDWEEEREPDNNSGERVPPSTWSDASSGRSKTKRGSRGGKKKRRRADVNNPRRQIQPDDYESGNPAHRHRDEMSEAGEPLGRERGQDVDEERNRRFPIVVMGRLFGGLTVIPTHPCLDPPEHACFNCWQRGHAVNDCPRERREGYCLNCGRRGCAITTCPRCREQYARRAATKRREGEGPFRVPPVPQAPARLSQAAVEPWRRRRSPPALENRRPEPLSRDRSREEQRGPTDLRARLGEARGLGGAPVRRTEPLAQPPPIPRQLSEEERREREQRARHSTVEGGPWSREQLEQLQHLLDQLREYPAALRDTMMRRAFGPSDK